MTQIKKTKDGIEVYEPKDRKSWRNWLKKHAATKNNVWLIIYKKASGKKSIEYIDAVEEALCFGWIDSKAVKRDDESVYQYMSKRKPRGNWSKVNKERIERLIANGSMTAQGMQVIEAAKQNGSWTLLDDVEALKLPADLIRLLKSTPNARAGFESYPASLKKQVLHRIKSAKREETRSKRIEEIVALAAKNERPSTWVSRKAK